MTHWLTELRSRLGLWKARALAWPPVGTVRFGSFVRTQPISTRFGLDRGGALDRVYIEQFLGTHAIDVRGRVLEFGDDGYTRAFGGDRVTHSDVVHPSPGHPGASLCGDLRTGAGFPSAGFDCVVCTQVLQFVFELDAALATLRRSLAPGGVLLGTVPAVSMQSPTDAEQFGEYWRFTSGGVRALLQRHFPKDRIEVVAFGNVLAATAFLHGLGRGEVTEAQLAVRDPAYEVVVGFRTIAD